MGSSRFCVLLYVLFGFVFASDGGTTWDATAQIMPWFAHPLAGMCVLAGHRAVTRAHRDNAEELFESCPTSPASRTVGFVWPAWVPMVTFTAFLLLLGPTLLVRSPKLHGPLGVRDIADVSAAILLAAGGLALGVAIGRWINFGLAPVAAVVGVAIISLNLNLVGDPGWNPLTQLASAPALADQDSLFTDRPAWGHLLWLSGLTVAVVVVAVARHRRDRVVASAAVLAAAMALVGAIVVTRPLPRATAERIADLIARPEAHQDCVAASASMQVCAYRPYGELHDRVVDRVRPLAGALPSEMVLTLRQRFNGTDEDLPPEIRNLLPGGIPPPPAGEIVFGFDAGVGALDDTALDVAFSALGLPVIAETQSRPLVFVGEARGVVALWLVTRGLDLDNARALTVVAPDDCDAPPAIWSPQDLAAARALIALPEHVVAAIVIDGWTRWSSGTTGTDELLAAAGLPAIGPFDQVEPQLGSPC
jgi:hypothetical protein